MKPSHKVRKEAMSSAPNAPTRRGFLKALGITAAGLALLPTLEPQKWFFFGDTGGIILWGDGRHDDTAALQRYLDTGRIRRPDGTWLEARHEIVVPSGEYRVSDTVILRDRGIIDSSSFATTTGKPVLYMPADIRGQVTNNYFRNLSRGMTYGSAGDITVG